MGLPEWRDIPGYKTVGGYVWKFKRRNDLLGYQF